jgi:cytohesin
MHEAALQGNAAIMGILIKAGSDIEALTNKQRSPLNIAAWAGYSECIKLLLDAGADPDIGDINKITPIHQAADCGHSECLALLLKTGTCINVRTDAGYTPLSLAISNKDHNCAEILLEAGADPNIPDINGNTALHEAAERGLVGLMRRLVLFGADIYAVNVKENNPLDLLKNSFPTKYSRSAEPLQRLAEKIRSKHLNKEDRAGSSVTGYEFDI